MTQITCAKLLDFIELRIQAVVDPEKHVMAR